MAGSVIDIDKGYRRAMNQFRFMDRVTLKVGSFDVIVNQYAIVQEARNGFIRDTVDSSDKLAGEKIRSAILAGLNGRELARQQAEKLAEQIRARIKSLRLIKTGALLDSIEIKESRE